MASAWDKCHENSHDLAPLTAYKYHPLSPFQNIINLPPLPQTRSSNAFNRNTMKFTAFLAFASLALTTALPDATPDATAPETLPDISNITASELMARQGAPCLIRAHWENNWSEADWHRFRVRVDVSGKTAGGLGPREMLDEWMKMFDCNSLPLTREKYYTLTTGSGFREFG